MICPTLVTLTEYSQKDTHREKAPSKKLQRIWAFGSLVHQKSIRLKEVLKLKNIFRKRKVVTGKTHFFMIGPFCTSSFYLASNIAVLYGNDAFSILVLLIEKRYSSFFEKGLSIENVQSFH